MDAHEAHILIVELSDRRVVLDGRDRSVLQLGSDYGVQTHSTFTSRRHARIEVVQNDYVLVDHSTNGTFIQTEDEQILRVHRDQARLWGAGWICLGEPLNAESAIRFRLQ